MLSRGQKYRNLRNSGGTYTLDSVIQALLHSGNGRSGNGCLAKNEGTFRLWEGHSTIILRIVVMIMIVAVVVVVVEMKEEMNGASQMRRKDLFCCKSYVNH